MLSGVIDRVDVEAGVGNRRAIVRDYKSGAKRDTWLTAARWASDDQEAPGGASLHARRQASARAAIRSPASTSAADRRGPASPAASTRRLRRDLVTTASSRTRSLLEELEELLAEIEEQAVALATELRSGALTPCPEQCSSNGGCRHPGLCWAG